GEEQHGAAQRGGEAGDAGGIQARQVAGEPSPLLVSDAVEQHERTREQDGSLAGELEATQPHAEQEERGQVERAAEAEEGDARQDEGSKEGCGERQCPAPPGAKQAMRVERGADDDDGEDSLQEPEMVVAKDVDAPQITKVGSMVDAWRHR